MSPLESLRVLGHVVEREAEAPADRLEQRTCKVTLVKGAARRPTEGGLERVGVDYAELFVHDNAPTRFFRLVHHEGAVFKVEVFTVLFEHPKLLIFVTYFGKMRSFSLSEGLVYELPYMKQFRPVECPCMSQKK